MKKIFFALIMICSFSNGYAAENEFMATIWKCESSTGDKIDFFESKDKEIFGLLRGENFSQILVRSIKHEIVEGAYHYSFTVIGDFSMVLLPKLDPMRLEGTTEYSHDGKTLSTHTICKMGP